MSKKLKVDFHIHTAEDPHDHIPYDSFQLIDLAGQKGFDVLAITNHNEVLNSAKLAEYAEKKGILLIPGMEANYSDKHVLIINPDFTINPPGRSLDELERIKNENNLIIAAHPFYPGFKSLESELLTHIHLFDAIEFSQYYNKLINFNKQAVEIAKEYGKPLIGNSDCHFLREFGKTYSLVEADKDIRSVIAAVKSGKVERVVKPVSLYTMSRVMLTFTLRRILYERKKRKKNTLMQPHY
jgi:predicted metal-dependent phosphoesterase TrpH